MFGRKPKRIDTNEPRVIADPVRARERTMNRAGRLLAAKPRSVRELRERLLEKQWTNHEIVDEVIEKLKGYKYLDDEHFALETAMSKFRQRPQGKRRLQQAMSQKKLEKDTLDAAIAEAFEKLPEEDLIDAVIEKRLRLKGRPETREEMKKFYDHLLRQGFEYDLIRTRISAIAKLDIE